MSNDTQWWAGVPVLLDETLAPDEWAISNGDGTRTVHRLVPDEVQQPLQKQVAAMSDSLIKYHYAVVNIINAYGERGEAPLYKALVKLREVGVEAQGVLEAAGVRSVQPVRTLKHEVLLRRHLKLIQALRARGIFPVADSDDNWSM